MAVAIVAADTVAEATAVAVMAGRGVKVAGRAGLVQADHVVGSANIFARKKSASFAWRRWTSSTTNARTFCRSLCRNAARFYPGA
jgi:hypothetical protein